MISFRHSLLSGLVLLGVVSCDTGLHAGDDLWRYITRPDLMPPKFNTLYHNRSQVSPGYYFLSTFNGGHALHDTIWSSCQFGPMIYDHDMNLVWSGACQFDNRAVFDFGTAEIDGKPVLKGIVNHAEFVSGEPDDGALFLLGQDYEMMTALKFNDEDTKVDLHEFNIMPKTNSALIATRKPGFVSAETIGYPDQNIWIGANGFKEIDMHTGDTIFKWWCHEHLGLDESTFNLTGPGGAPQPEWYSPNHVWDTYHVNAVDKTADGNYLVGMRHADMVAFVDGKDGHIIWRVGGVKNDFIMEDDFTFSRQHDARFISHGEHRSVISMLDNASGNRKQDYADPSNPYSRGLIIELNHRVGSPFRARVLHKYDRPDHKHSEQRGSLQILANGNVLMAWTDAGYISEHTEDGNPVMETQFFNDHRLNLYRAYKTDKWIGRPLNAPVIKALGYSAGQGKPATVIYVSWNGATAHRLWKFYSDGEYIGETNRTGFETAFMTESTTGQIHAEAYDKDGQLIGQSEKVITEYAPGMKPVPGSASGSSSSSYGWFFPWGVFFAIVVMAIGAYLLVGAAEGRLGGKWWKRNNDDDLGKYEPTSSSEV